MPITMPRVSVIIPTYNCQTYIAEAVESVLAQTYQDFELIVIDDGSTDNTRQVLEPYLDRIIYLYQENQGESVARNRGIQVAQGEYIAFLDSDDLWLLHKLERQVAVMDALPEAVLVYSYSYAINASRERISHRGSNRVGQGETGLHSVFEQLVTNNFISNPGTVMVRKQILESMTPFDPALQWGEDWDLWLRLSLKGPFAFVPEPLACYRIRQPGRRLRIEASDEFVRQNEIILHKVFDSLPEDRANLRHLRPRAFAALYLRSAVWNFELGDTTLGSHYIERAVQADPGFGRDGNEFARRVAYEGFRIAGESGDIAEGVDFVNLVFEHLPPSAGKLREYRPHALSEIHMAAAFSQFERGNRAATLRHAIQAIRNYPPRARNRGLISIGVQALIGGKPWAMLLRSRRLHTPPRKPVDERMKELSNQSARELYRNLVEKKWTHKYDLYQPCLDSVNYLNHVQSPSISVIVVSWRWHPDTIRNFKVLAQQRDQNYELIFVDNGGHPGEFDILKPYVDTYVKLNQNTGACLGRNFGAVFANAPVLLFLEDDGIPAHNIIEAHLETFDKYDVVAVRGVYSPKTRNPLNYLAEHYYLGDRPFPIFADVEGNTSYNGKLFFQVGGWDGEIWFGEGADLSLRLLSVEPDMRKQIYSPEPMLYHDFARDQEHLKRKQRIQENSRKRLRQKHPDFESFLSSWSKYYQREDLLIKREQSGRLVSILRAFRKSRNLSNYAKSKRDYPYL